MLFIPFHVYVYILFLCSDDYIETLVMLPHLLRCSRILLQLGKSSRNSTPRKFQTGSNGERGLVIYDEANANNQLLRYGRLGLCIQVGTLLIGAEVAHAVRTKDEIEKEVNPNIQVNMYTGKYGFLMAPALVTLACAFTIGGYFFFGRIVKKILYIPSSERVTFITHHLFGGENIKTTTLGGIQTHLNYCKVDGYSWRFILADDAEIPNKQMFNVVMGSSSSEF